MISRFGFSARKRCGGPGVPGGTSGIRFLRMPEFVLEGRRVVNNIQRSASLFLVKNIFSFLLAIFSAVFMITYPLEPSQVSLISMYTIGIPAFFLALQPNRDIIKTAEKIASRKEKIFFTRNRLAER